jgi:hypothetical protein
MPPQKVVSSRITSTAGSRDVGGELLEVDHHGVGREGNVHHPAKTAHPVQAPGRVLVVVVVEVTIARPKRMPSSTLKAAFGS